ncbi:MAG: hypothetical protein GY790_05200 [Bacteroidetes bacterium]|nr:hypothetical protein [Bacteroidota bacterium]
MVFFQVLRSRTDTIEEDAVSVVVPSIRYKTELLSSSILYLLLYSFTQVKVVEST